MSYQYTPLQDTIYILFAVVMLAVSAYAGDLPVSLLGYSD